MAGTFSWDGSAGSPDSSAGSPDSSAGRVAVVTGGANCRRMPRRRVFNVNVTGTFMMTQALARHCAARGADGASVVSITTGSARGTQRRAVRPALGGDIPNAIERPPGCHFEPRCPLAMAACRERDPALLQLAGDRSVACHLHDPAVLGTAAGAVWSLVGVGLHLGVGGKSGQVVVVDLLTQPGEVA